MNKTEKKITTILTQTRYQKYFKIKLAYSLIEYSKVRGVWLY